MATPHPRPLPEEEGADARRWSGEVTRRWGRLVDDVHRRIGPGAGLEPGTRAMFEGRLGGDLSAAMVHRGPLAGRLARSLGAEALSAGSHVLGDDHLEASDARGAALLGHELMHVLQRDVDDGQGSNEAEAQVIERALATSAPVAEAGGVDVDALAERVYRRLVDELQLERARGAWMA